MKFSISWFDHDRQIEKCCTCCECFPRNLPQDQQVKNNTHIVLKNLVNCRDVLQ